ncbi:hypothetical protein [Lewinella sp. LCG006]|uniref:hypothetical protein n=1 Tax=Lewinella sp. LCG006 TaxID=3231911 RepID=UPI00345FA1F2
MENFDKIRTSIFGSPLLITAVSVPLARKPKRSEVKIEMNFRGLQATITTNGPITHPSMMLPTAPKFPTMKIRKELKIIEGLFLEAYTSQMSRMAMLQKVFEAYRDLGTELTITTSKHTQDVNGNS